MFIRFIFFGEKLIQDREETDEPENSPASKKAEPTQSRIEESSLLTEEQISTFIRDGVLVVPSVLTPEEVAVARAGFHQHLLDSSGVDASSFASLERTSGGLRSLSSTNGSGGVLDIFYAAFKLRLAEHPAIFGVVSELWRATFAQIGQSDQLWSHPYGPFDPSRGFAYIDRVGYRVPSRIAELHAVKKRKLQRSLTPHLDCCPHDFYGTTQGGKVVSKWRPIQCFIALTPTPEAELGGLEAARGFHRDFESWAHSRPPEPSAESSRAVPALGQPARASAPKQKSGRRKEEEQPSGDPRRKAMLPPCVGEFTPIRPREDSAVLKRVAHVPCGPGDLVLWDNRIPHSNSRENRADGSEEEKKRLWGCDVDQAHVGTPHGVSVVPWSGGREVVYLGFLPDVPLNQEYARAQRQRFERGSSPDDQWREATGRTPPLLAAPSLPSKGAGGAIVFAGDCPSGTVATPSASSTTAKARPPSSFEFSALGRKLMGIDSWG